MSKGLYQRTRPEKFAEVKGQDTAVRQLKGLIKSRFPNAVLFSGPSGTGKTTLVRIVAKYLKCDKTQFHEYDCASNGGIDVIRDIRKNCIYPPLKGDSKIYYIDEAHGLSRQAQEAFLKILEDGPEHTYFVLATTQPKQLHKTIFTRVTEVKLKPVSESALVQVIKQAAEKEEGVEVHSDVAKEIARNSDGSPRKALVILEQCLSVQGVDAQLEIAKVADTEAGTSFELAKLICDPKSSWLKIAAAIKNLDEDPEATRYVIMGYAQAILLNQKSANNAFAKHQHKVLECFEDSVMYSKKPGLTKRAFETSSL